MSQIISSLEPLPRFLAAGCSDLGLLGEAGIAPRPVAEGGNRARVGTASLRQIVGAAVMQAEGDAIRRALGITGGNKSQAARLLRTNYTTLHAKMRRYGIRPHEFKG